VPVCPLVYVRPSGILWYVCRRWNLYWKWSSRLIYHNFRLAPVSPRLDSAVYHMEWWLGSLTVWPLVQVCQFWFTLLSYLLVFKQSFQYYNVYLVFDLFKRPFETCTHIWNVLSENIIKWPQHFYIPRRESILSPPWPYVRPLSYPEQNLKTIGDNLFKLHTVVKRFQKNHNSILSRF
jgi:hypothetical protein